MKHLLCLLLLFSTACSKPAPHNCPMPAEIQSTSYQELDTNYQSLVDAASEVLQNSYNPYSKFAVGAALLAEDGTIITGTNFENAAYGSTICAERAAILRANSMGYRKFKAIAVIGRGQDFMMPEPISPCGACRQVIYEISSLADQHMDVLMSNSSKNKIFISPITELLPLAFGPKDLDL